MNILKFVWRNILARKYLWQYYRGFKDAWRNQLKETIEMKDIVDPEYRDSIDYLQKNGATFYPYKGSIWTKKMPLLKYPIFWDEQEETYISFKGSDRKRKRIWCTFRTLAAILTEQNERSAHRYFSDSCHVKEGDILVDVGTAEGFIALDSIEKAEKIYLIESDEQKWKNNLEKTFLPYKEKTNIIYKFASDINDKDNVTLDCLLKEDITSQSIVIKIDVEGNEMKVLRDAENLLGRDNVKFVVCTYHNDTDADEFLQFFTDRGYQTEFSDGYLWVPLFSEKAPFLNKGVIRAWKTS